jgi:hypothetical protein
MTLDELNSLRFNVPIHSNVDNTLWYYDCRLGGGHRIFKQLIETEYTELGRRGRTLLMQHTWGDNEPWKRVGELIVSEEMLLNDFDLVYKIVEPDLELVKKNKSLMTPYSLVKPNFHMMDLPF